MSDNQISDNLNKLIYQGGLQKHFAKNYAEKYSWNIMNDASNFCLKDFSDSTLSESELDCLRNYHFKNQVFMVIHQQ